MIYHRAIYHRAIAARAIYHRAIYHRAIYHRAIADGAPVGLERLGPTLISNEPARVAG